MSRSKNAGDRSAGLGQGRPWEISSTEAQNNFGRVLGHVARDGTVVIRKRDVPEAVVISYDRYQALTNAESPVLNSLSEEFDAMLASMQSAAAVAGAERAFAATPEELGRAAIAAAQRRKR